jgi:hypothetical protein
MSSTQNFMGAIIVPIAGRLLNEFSRNVIGFYNPSKLFSPRRLCHVPSGQEINKK